MPERDTQLRERAENRLSSFTETEPVQVYDHERGLAPRLATDFELDLRGEVLALLDRLEAVECERDTMRGALDDIDARTRETADTPAGHWGRALGDIARGALAGAPAAPPNEEKRPCPTCGNRDWIWLAGIVEDTAVTCDQCAPPNEETRG